MELTTLGDALKFAMELEKQAVTTYEEGGRAAEQPELRDTLLAFSAVNRKRNALLEKQYRDNVYSDMDTGVFEPLASIEGDQYLTQIQSTHGLPPSDLLRKAMEREEKNRDFYLDLCGKLKSRRPGMARIFEKMAQENSDRRVRLKAFCDKIL